MFVYDSQTLQLEVNCMKFICREEQKTYLFMAFITIAIYRHIYFERRY